MPFAHRAYTSYLPLACSSAARADQEPRASLCQRRVQTHVRLQLNACAQPPRAHHTTHAVRRYDSTSPSPPPPPLPPPKTIFYTPQPPSPSPPPLPPPPYYEDAEDCIPIPTATTFGTDLAGFTRENADASVVEWRSACLWARRAIDKRIRAKSCFSGVISPSPPPPPTSGAGGVEGAQANIEREEDRRVDGDDAQYGGVPVDPATFYADEVKGGIAETTALIQSLGNSNPILRNLLAGAIGEMETSVERVASGAVSAQQYSGRRLMQRRFEYVQLLSDALVDHSIMKPSAGTGGYGKEGIPGVTVETCMAL